MTLCASDALQGVRCNFDGIEGNTHYRSELVCLRRAAVVLRDNYLTVYLVREIRRKLPEDFIPPRKPRVNIFCGRTRRDTRVTDRTKLGSIAAINLLRMTAKTRIVIRIT